MAILQLTAKDNSTHSYKRLVEFSRDHNVIKSLKYLSGKTLRELVERHGVIAMPPIDAADLSQQIFSYDGDHTIYTNNLVGFIGSDSVNISIKSRFAEGKNDYFFHYLLSKVFSINIMDLMHNISQENILDFMPYLFPHYLKKAYIQGIYREYTSIRHNDNSVRGVMDVVRHISSNTPFTGNVAYNTREKVADNPINQLIRHTIEFLLSSYRTRSILDADSLTKEAVQVIRIITPSFSMRKLKNVLNCNVRPFNHPYFQAYAPLQKICMMILRHQGLKYADNKHRFYGIVFDCAWLWEEYLYKIMKDIDIIHPENRKKIGGKALIVGRRYPDQAVFDKYYAEARYPDFYNHKWVIDAKYKHLDRQMGRDDIHQLVTYMYMLRKDYGAFIYPSVSQERTDVEYKLAGHGGLLAPVGMRIPQQCSCFAEFKEKMEHSEHRLLNYL